MKKEGCGKVCRLTSPSSQPRVSTMTEQEIFQRGSFELTVDVSDGWDIMTPFFLQADVKLGVPSSSGDGDREEEAERVNLVFAARTIWKGRIFFFLIGHMAGG